MAFPPEQDPLYEPEPEASRGGSKVLIGVVAVLALAGALYWAMRPGTVTQTTALETRPADTGGASGAATPADASAQARAWNAAAGANDAPATTTPGAAPATPIPASSQASAAGTIEEMVDRVMPAVVLIETSSGRGSGFFVRHDTLITNVHVVQNDAYVTLRRMDGSTLNARVDARAPAFDIAVLKVTTPSPSQAVIPMGSTQSLKPGQEVIVIGSALGTLQNSVSRGIVSGLRSSGGATLVQTDAASNPGNSGGPMLDRNGQVIGITTMSYKGAEGLNFGVAIDHARDLLEGRQANLGNLSGLTDIQTQSKGSESDRLQQQGGEQLRAHIAELAGAASQIDAAWKRYRDQCYRSALSGSYNREWFAMLAPRGMPANAGAGCPAYYAALETDIKQFHGAVRTMIGDARRANVLPGTVRDLLRSNRLDFEWDR